MGLLRLGLRSGSGLRWGFGLRSGFDLERRNAGPEENNCATKRKKQCQPWRVRGVWAAHLQVGGKQNAVGAALHASKPIRRQSRASAACPQ